MRIKTVNVTVVTAGIRVAASTTGRVPAAWISIQADVNNTNNIYHGDINVSSSRGHAIASGGGGETPQYPTMGGCTYDLSELYFDADTSGNIAHIIYGQR